MTMQLVDGCSASQNTYIVFAFSGFCYDYIPVGFSQIIHRHLNGSEYNLQRRGKIFVNVFELVN